MTTFMSHSYKKNTIHNLCITTFSCHILYLSSKHFKMLARVSNWWTDITMERGVACGCKDGNGHPVNVMITEDVVEGRDDQSG